MVVAKTGIGYAIGTGADAISQYAAFGSVNWQYAATSESAVAGGVSGFLAGVVPGGGAVATEGTAESGLLRALSKSEQKAIRSLEDHIAEHEKKIADFKSNPTVRPGMENMPREIIEAQQARRLQHLQQEIDAARKNIQDISNGTSNAGKQ